MGTGYIFKRNDCINGTFSIWQRGTTNNEQEEYMECLAYFYKRPKETTL